MLYQFWPDYKGHVNPLFITKLLEKEGKEKSTNYEMSQHIWKNRWKWSADGIRVQMEFQF
jgi:hypothetical protein